MQAIWNTLDFPSSDLVALNAIFFSYLNAFNMVLVFFYRQQDVKLWPLVKKLFYTQNYSTSVKDITHDQNLSNQANRKSTQAKNNSVPMNKIKHYNTVPRDIATHPIHRFD